VSNLVDRKTKVITLGIAFACALVTAAPAAAELPTSPLVDIYESYNDCFKVAAMDGFKPEVLASLGWLRATMTGPDGKPVANAPIIFANPKRKPIIFLSSEKDGAVCTVMARLANVEAFAEFQKAWGGKLPAPDKNGIIGFYAEGRPVALRATGTREKPALTISVMTPMEKK
jgi:hypothetical protein